MSQEQIASDAALYIQNVLSSHKGNLEPCLSLMNRLT
jgi:hypothetical protein